MSYPVEDYNYLFNWGKTVEVFAGVAITCMAIYTLAKLALGQGK
ncbi:hypothetical protein [Enterococcus lactis]